MICESSCCAQARDENKNRMESRFKQAIRYSPTSFVSWARMAAARVHPLQLPIRALTEQRGHFCVVGRFFVREKTCARTSR
jgi:hypothetical protein